MKRKLFTLAVLLSSIGMAAHAQYGYEELFCDSQFESSTELSQSLSGWGQYAVIFLESSSTTYATYPVWAWVSVHQVGGSTYNLTTYYPDMQAVGPIYIDNQPSQQEYFELELEAFCANGGQSWVSAGIIYP